jgi:Flp pilus assembly pilin Flp
MSRNSSTKKSHPPGSRRRALVGASIIVALVIVGGIVGVLIIDKGVKGSLSAIFTSICFAIILLLYWRNQKWDGES